MAAAADAELPRTLDVQEYVNARVREIHSLSLALRQRNGRVLLWGEEPLGPVAAVRHMRRRTKSHNRRKVLFRLKKKRPKVDSHEGLDATLPQAKPPNDATVADRLGGKGQDGTEVSEGPSEAGGSSAHKLCRRLRRRNVLKNTCGGGSWTGEGVRRLESHVWHAKRFSMVHRWGHVLAQGLLGRGRGSRSTLRALRTASLLHDASYHAQAHLAGPQESLQSVLALLGGPPSAPSSWGQCHKGLFNQSFVEGSCTGSFLLRGGGVTVGPAVAIWRPKSANHEQAGKERKVLLLLHPAAVEESLEAIRGVVDRQVPEARVLERPQRMCQLELVGTSALKVLRTVLRPAASKDSHQLAWRLFRQAENLPDGAILGLQVADPRAWRPEGEGSGMPEEDTPVPSATPHPSWPELLESGQLALSADPPGLWAPSSDLPETDAGLCEKRRQREVAVSTEGEGEGGGKREAEVPVVLLKRGSAARGWTLLLPQGWSRPFWVPLVKAGGHAIGLREHRWAAAQAGVPLFPYDFPDCPAHQRESVEEDRLKAVEYEKKPKAKRSPLPPQAGGWGDPSRGEEGRPAGEASQERPRGIPSVVRVDAWEDGRVEGNVRRGLWEGKLRWQAVQERGQGAGGGGEEVQLVQVAVVMPRKGNAEERAHICGASREDFEAWCQRSPKWQGVEDTTATPPRSAQKSKRQKQKAALKQQAVTGGPQSCPEPGAECEMESERGGDKFRGVVGYITSEAPRGSLSGRAMGVCRLDFFEKARAKQYSEWVGGGETIVALVKNVGSTMFRPALVSLLKEGI